MTDSQILQVLYNDMQTLKPKVSRIDEETQQLKDDVCNIKLLLENEIKENIMRD